MTTPSFLRLVLLTGSILLLLCACDKSDTSYIYLKPKLVVYDTTARKELMVDDECRFPDVFFSVIIPVDEYKEASLIPFVTKAYARSVRGPYYRPLEKIKSIKIVTLKEYNSQYPAGADMTDSCIFRTDTYRPEDSAYGAKNSTYGKTDVPGLINELNHTYEYSSRLSHYYGSAISFSFSIRNMPLAEGVQQFVIKFETEEGAQFSDTSVHFTLKP